MQSLSAKQVIDIVFIASVIIAVALTALILFRVMQEETQSAMIVVDPDVEGLTQEFQDFAQERPQFAITTTDSAMLDPLRELSPLILPITWGAVVGALIWRGKVRSRWSKQGYDYDMFRLVARMRGSATRISLLNAVTDRPKNKLQLAKELGVDWKTIDNHVEMLLKNGLLEEKMSIGTSRYFGATKDTSKVLSLLSEASSSEGSSTANGLQ